MKPHFLCPVCRSQKFFLYYQTKDRMFDLPGTFTVKSCRDCGLVLLDPQPNSLTLARHYPSKHYYAYKQSNKGLFNYLREYLIRHYYSQNVFTRIITLAVGGVPALPTARKGRILDVGCGTGDTLICLKHLGWEVYGTEIDKKAVNIAQKKGLTNVRLGTFEDLENYPENYFDVIRLYHVIEHLDDPVKCFKLLHKKLKKNGELIIGTPNIDSIVARIFGPYWYNLDSPRHLFLFTTRTLTRIAEIEGFTAKKVEFCSAGGLVGSLQYWLNDKFNLKADLVHQLWCILLFYPLEWFLDKLKMGDVFVIRAIK